MALVGISSTVMSQLLPYLPRSLGDLFKAGRSEMHHSLDFTVTVVVPQR